MKKSKHEWKSNGLPALVTVGPVAVILVFLVVLPLMYVAVMSFCSIDSYYNVVYKFTLRNYAQLADPDYIHISGVT
jgi:spermidine/putrescine transport system permease protein